MKTHHMRPTLAIALLFTAATASAGIFGTKGNGQKVTESRTVKDFKRIELKLPLDVTIHQGKDFAVSITTDSNLMPLITTEVSGDLLQISGKESLGWFRGKNTADITLPDLRAIHIRGSGDVKVSGFQDGVDRALKVAGSGDIHFTGNAGKLAVTIDGSGNVSLGTGTAELLDLEVNGSGDVSAKALKVKDAKIAVNGSGDAEVTLSGGSLQATVNGSGDITWHGEAKSVSAAKHGSGDVKHDGA